MPRETKEAKAVRLLYDQRVRFEELSPASCLVRVHGETDDYNVEQQGGRWQCSCVNGSSRCSHILAVQTVYRAVIPALVKGEGGEGKHADDEGCRYFGE